MTVQPTPAQVSEIGRLMGESIAALGRNKKLRPDQVAATKEASDMIQSWGFSSLQEFWSAVPKEQRGPFLCFGLARSGRRFVDSSGTKK